MTKIIVVSRGHYLVGMPDDSNGRIVFVCNEPIIKKQIQLARIDMRHALELLFFCCYFYLIVYA